MRFGFGLGVSADPPAATTTGAPPAFSPADLPGLGYALHDWVRADGSGTLRGDPSGNAYTGGFTNTAAIEAAMAPGDAYFVSAWGNAGNQGRGAWTQATAIRQPELKLANSAAAINGKPTLKFGPADTFFSLQSFAGLTQAEVFVAVKLASDPPPSNATAGLWILSSASAGWFPFPSEGNVYEGALSTTRRNIGNPAPSLAAMRVYGIVSTPAEWTVRLDGAEFFTTGTNTFQAYTTPRVGISNTGVALAGDLVEFILCAPLDATTRQQVVNYLTGRWQP
ncbi:MAG TPA: hypothetical protein VFG47_03430 [Geminicoccaceae bacterium]|nr:hypothetical protein [Geminicoccaceae bacterium]